LNQYTTKSFKKLALKNVKASGKQTIDILSMLSGLIERRFCLLENARM
jgi:hypothetical protein